mgnify:CR=1 FL=1
MKCEKESAAQLDRHFIEPVGSCQYNYKETCSYKCNDGYLTSGVTQLTCGAGGKMDLPLPMCHREYGMGIHLM